MIFGLVQNIALAISMEKVTHELIMLGNMDKLTEAHYQRNLGKHPPLKSLKDDFFFHNRVTLPPLHSVP